ncbi:MAG: ribulokinase [Bacteroidota bacterium]
MEEISKLVIGVDFGTDSVRSVLIDASNGKELTHAVHEYEMWKAGKFCNPSKNQFRQHPLDYVEGLTATIKSIVSHLNEQERQNIVSISVDTTGSTIVAIDEVGVPLAMTPDFEENPHAMFILWKDHTATKEADEINHTAKNWGGEDYTKYEGGVYSSEWFWAKILRTLRVDDQVREKAYSWVEHCDWIPALLTGTTHPSQLKRGRCSAGHKAMWHETFGGLPPEDFFIALDPILAGIRARLNMQKTYTADTAVGTLTSQWAATLGLSTNVKIGIGAFDCHMGAVGGEIQPYELCKVMGTSTCDILVAPSEEVKDKLVKGICGQVDGSVIPGMEGMEAGQSAFGDVYAWFKEILAWPINTILNNSQLIDEKIKAALIEETLDNIIPKLNIAAAATPLEVKGEVAIDWLNGRRTPDANQLLKGAITGLNLGSDTPKIFRSLVEATAFGAKAIVDRFVDEGIEIRKIITLGGVAKKSPFVMQTMADVLNMPIKVVSSEQTCALGAAMFAATVAGIYPNVETAQQAMGNGFDKEYIPIAENVKKYAVLYKRYQKIGGFLEGLTKNKISNLERLKV